VRVGRVTLVGAGPGDPGLLTVRGCRRLRRADVVVYDRLVDPRLLDEGPPHALRIFTGKMRGVHTLPQGDINALLVAHAHRGKRVVRLKGGDPFVFGRGGEEAEALAAAGVLCEVIPGVSSAIAVPASAGIPVTHRGVASSFAVVTGARKPRKRSWARSPTSPRRPRGRDSRPGRRRDRRGRPPARSARPSASPRRRGAWSLDTPGGSPLDNQSERIRPGAPGMKFETV
jgi:siroheme synthase